MTRASELLSEARPIDGLTLAQVAREIPGETSISGDASRGIFGVQHDSREVAPGDLFVVRRGEKYDARVFVADAVERGAAALAAAHDLELPPCELPVLRVPDIGAALAYAAAAVYGHPSWALEVVGITGTNGKTTTTHLVRAAVDAARGGAFCGIVGTIGHRFAGLSVAAAHTTPEADELARVLTAMRKRGASHVAMEVSSIAIVLQRAAAVRFRVAAFTNLTQDHLDFHGTMDAYRAAKMQFFTDMEPGLAVVNVDDPFGVEITRAAHCKVFRVRTRAPGAGLDAPPSSDDVALVRAAPDLTGTRIVARVLGRELDLSTRLVGAHNVENVLVALGVVAALGLDVDQAAAGLEVETGAPGRLERCDGEGDDVVVLVDYAHTPDALARVLAALRVHLGGREAGRAGRLVCVFGCGGDRDPSKREPMGAAAGEAADVVIVTSDNPRSEAPELIAAAAERGVRAAGALAVSDTRPDALPGVDRGYVVELDRRRAIELAIAGARPGDVVLVAGKGHEDYQIVGHEKRPFDDRVEVRAALDRRRARARQSGKAG